MSDEQLPPTHRSWGDRSNESSGSSWTSPSQGHPGNGDPDETAPFAPQRPAEQQPGQPYAPPPNPYGGPTPPPTTPYGAPATPYGAPPPYGAPAGYPGYQPAQGGYGAPDHPQSTTAMVLGIVALVGIVLCSGLTLVISPFAWVIGGRAVREIDASQGRWGGRDKARAGQIMGIIGTVLLVLGILAIVGFVVLVVSTAGSSSSTPVVPTGSNFVDS